MAICLVSACCQLATRAFWIELPVVLHVIPPALPPPTPSTRLSFATIIQEGSDASSALAESYGNRGGGTGNGDHGVRWSLPVENQGRLFAAVVVGSNAAACFFYLAARRICSRHRRPVESRAVWASLAIGVASLAIAACGFELGSRLDDEDDGAIFEAGEIPMVTVLIGAALSSVGATTGALALMSVVGQFGTVTSVGGVGAAHYVCAVMFGDALASAVPRGLSVAQG
jgi:hypothetical protein